jgi:YHS domain-containing protein
MVALHFCPGRADDQPHGEGEEEQMDRISRSLDEGRITFAEPGTRVVDPVCGMEIERARAAGMTDFGGVRYYFCSESCKKQFEDDPVRFVGEEETEEPPPAGR